MSESNTAIISKDDIMKILDNCYEAYLNGIPKVSDDTLSDRKSSINIFTDIIDKVVNR